MKDKTNNSFKNRLKYSMSVLLFPSLLIFIVGPLEIFAGNKEEFLFGVKDFIWIFAAIFLGVWLISSLIISIYKGKLYSVILTIIFSLSLLCYFQNLFFNKKLMSVAGNKMDWQQLKNTMIINTITWVIGLVLICTISYFLKENRRKIFSYICISLSIVQLITIASLIYSTGYRGLGKEELVLSGEQQFQYAPNENIIVLVLDAYSRDAFINTSAEYPEIKECFKDFTFYDNADCHYFYTVPSMLHLITGEEIDFNRYFEDYKEEAWSGEKCVKFYQMLHDNGYTCRLYDSNQAHMYYGDLTLLQGKYDNFTYGEPRKDYRLMTTLLGKMSVYKYAPYIVKPKFEVMTYSFNDTVVYDHWNNSIAYWNHEVMDSLNKKSLTINDEMENSFTVMHIQGYHIPFNFDANGKECTETTAEETQKGLSLMLTTYFDDLKEIGLYDSSTIIVTADHGQEFSYYEPQPILFIKQKNEKHDELVVNSAPVSHDDFRPTIISLIGEDYSEFGPSYFDWKEGDTRVRKDYFSIGDKQMSIFSYSTDESELVEHMKNMECDTVPTR